ncbi:hypothetical protein LX69_01100 [Breznakibacter xylanolyticus]|uniref:Lipocalin-like protein n=1 Tax=Breznakibacter xylanolyticus TaxID=990 RepID=A0A2W7NN32_9BACT|nr:hypothetical protein [Breznakibacter xylanolyticus]PZX18064.1 hypothetical protein LX69_01100 [Breznakibacter xylanolyticus]
MKNVLIYTFLSLSLLLASCVSKEEMLTKEKWFLAKKETKIEGTVVFKKSDNEWILTFDKDGDVKSIENSGLFPATLQWQILDGKTLKFVTSTKEVEFHISTLNEDQLSVWTYENGTFDDIHFTFFSETSELWDLYSDEYVDAYRSGK